MRNFTKLLILFVLCLVGMQGNAQNVTVHPGNGNMLPALKSGETDTFFGWNGFATWKHEQLSLTLTTGDSDNNSGTDADGQLARPANDIFASADGKSLQLGKGNSLNTYLTVTLPKGYRFRGYTIRFHRISSPNGASGSVNNYNGNISFGETNNAFAYISTTNTSANNITPYAGGIGQNNTGTFTIGRNSADMENVLYFMLYNGAVNGRAFIQLDFVEFLFTAENNYTPLIPAPNVTERSAVDIPFTTSKMDYGELKRYNIDGDEVTTGGRVSYNGTIHDMNANLILYENGSVKSVTDNGFDGTAGYMVDYKSGSISQAGDYFKLDGSKHGQKDLPITQTGATQNGEVIYYIESPIWATNSAAENAHKNPIGYRIIGADFDYTGGNLKFPAVFKIQYESQGHGADQDGTYGLNLYNGAIAYNWNYQSEWRIDDDGYIYNGQYYLQAGNSSTSTTLSVTTTKPNATRGTFEIVDNNGVKQIRRKSNTNYYIGWDEPTSWGSWTGARNAVLTNNANRRARYTELSHAYSENIGQYTFNIYDKTGTTVEQTVTVNGTSGTLSIRGLNNDAVKIGIVGKGVIKGHIIMQALDPYIDRLDIVCQEEGGNGGKLTQQFNSTDFSVRGGKFTFYVPQDFKAPAKFTFENLYSQYGDNTYYDPSSTNHARYFFVGSIYGDTNANVYNRSESALYTTKIACLKPGDKKFVFNNAATATSTTGQQFEEYPFSKALYASKVNGQFTDFMFSQEEMGSTPATEKTAYLFTCDETRYNIAPTTAMQHVYYAYYEMTIDMKKKDYVPVFAWEKVYDNTCYYLDDGTDTDKTDAMYGLKVTTTETVDDQGTHSGYVSVSQIKNGITAALGTTGAPTNMNQILYIDGSNLMNIVEDQTTTNGTSTTHKLSELKNGLAANALIYLPWGSSSKEDNFAYNTIAQYNQTPLFRGANNIVLTDKIPFFAKYDIYVSGDNYATYKRKITRPENGKVMNATLMLPFGLSIEGDEARHTNAVGEDCVFTINELKKVQTQDFEIEDGSRVNYGVGYFVPIQVNELGMSEANMPYMVKVESYADGEASFVATQKGATIAKTPNANYVKTLPSVTMTTGQALTNEATYSGKLYQRDDSENVLYFANNMFMDLHTLVSYRRTLYMYPFRSVYTYTGGGANPLRYMEVSYDDELTDGIQKMPANADLMVRSGNGVLQLEAQRGQTVTVRSLDGITVNSVSMNAGDSKVINLPAGVYIVNNVKIIVK